MTCKAINKGIDQHRLQHASNDLEIAFAEKWEKENECRPGINSGHGILQDLYLTQKDGKYQWITNEERIAAATAIQWLGTNCGFCFLNTVLEKCGYRIYDEEARELKQKKWEKERKKLEEKQKKELELQKRISRKLCFIWK